jgi:hypothetical protein
MTAIKHESMYSFMLGPACEPLTIDVILFSTTDKINQAINNLRKFPKNGNLNIERGIISLLEKQRDLFRVCSFYIVRVSPMRKTAYETLYF